MKNSTKLNRVLTTLITIGCLPVAMAASAQSDNYASYKENSWFMGMNLGKSSADIDAASIRTSLENDGFDVSAIGKDDGNAGYKFYLGYQFGPYLALEGGYFDLGDFSFQAETFPETNFSGNTDQTGWNLDLVGILPLTEQFSAFARVGYTQNNARSRFNSNGLISTTGYNSEDSYSKHKFGVGLQYDISSVLTLRLEAERYRMNDLVGNDGDIDLYSLGLVYRFGETTSRYTAPAAAQSASVTPRPATTVKPELLELQDVHFNFDTAELNTHTKDVLRRHVRTLKANPEARVRIAGYTSASGTKEYNQALSERRAQSIEDFLVDEGIAVSRLKTIGYGQSNPAEYESQPGEIRSAAANANMRGLFEIIIE